jgi:hypothetical protein
MAEKSLVNDEAETLGVGPELLLDGALADELELELELELPHADTATLAVIAIAASIVLLLSKYTISLLFSSVSNNPRHGRTAQRLSQ